MSDRFVGILSNAIQYSSWTEASSIVLSYFAVYFHNSSSFFSVEKYKSTAYDHIIPNR